MNNQAKKSRPIDYIRKFFATGSFTGYFPIAPGTWGSLLACIILWFVWPPQWYIQFAAIIVFYPIAVYFAGKAEAYFGHDGHPIVIDEVIGQMVTLFMAPHDLLVYVIGFLLFRAFDIIKPPPARGWEKFRGGFGIVADDMAAGVYAAITLQLLIVLLAKWGIEFL